MIPTTELARLTLVVALAGTAAGAASDSPAAGQEGRLAPRLENIGSLHHPVTTRSSEAQGYFDQGLSMVYAFNHYEAVRSFREAARLDPECAMAYWGEALALGPNINDPMPHERQLEAHAALQKAIALKAKVTEKERAYIDALARRYSKDKDADRQALDQSYAEAMGEVAKRYPDDPDAQTLTAASLMETMPWDYWETRSKPKPATRHVIATLEEVIRRWPDHAGAHHFYIHVVEASDNPDRAVPSAERLGGLMPSAGHLVHMPAHIFIRVGRYADAAESNVRAIAADEDYISQCQAQGLYPLGYYPHNIHFLWAASTLEGRSAAAIDAARKVAAKVPHDMMAEVHPLQDFYVVPLYAWTRFGKWEEILTSPPPPKDLLFPTGIWHYARGIAFAARGGLDRAEHELARLEKLLEDGSLDGVTIQFTPASEVLRLAAKIVAGEVAAKRGRTEAAIRVLREAVALQDTFRYSEPPAWHYPVRQTLGAVLLEAGRPEEAEAVYRKDLEENRENGWSLFGLMQSLRARNRHEEAAEVERRFRKAWARADVTLTSSRF